MNPATIRLKPHKAMIFTIVLLAAVFAALLAATIVLAIQSPHFDSLFLTLPIFLTLLAKSIVEINDKEIMVTDHSVLIQRRFGKPKEAFFEDSCISDGANIWFRAGVLSLTAFGNYSEVREALLQRQHLGLLEMKQAKRSGREYMVIGRATAFAMILCVALMVLQYFRVIPFVVFFACLQLWLIATALPTIWYPSYMWGKPDRGWSGRRL